MKKPYIMGALALTLIAGAGLAQAPKHSAGTVSSIEDIQLGMSIDSVITGLTKAGYTVASPVKFDRPSGPSGFWDARSHDQEVGTITAEDGLVDSAEKLVYDSQKADVNQSAISLAEALFWLFRDRSTTLPNDKRELRDTTVSAGIITRDIESRTAGMTWRMIFVHIGGASYRISMAQQEHNQSSVFIYETAPFVRKK
jgi:hypothetical protein